MKTRSPQTELLAAFALEEQISQRRARDLRKQCDPRWVGFLARRAVRKDSIVEAVHEKICPPKPNLAGFDDALAAAIDAQEIAYAELRRIMDKGDGTLTAMALKVCREAVDIRLRMEEAVLDHRIRSGELVSMTTAKALVNRCLEPIIAALDGLPGVCAGRCNPQSPLLAETVIREWVDDVKERVRGSILTIPPIPPIK